jgi:hypothetical protein
MASASFSVTRTSLSEGGPNQVTEGTLAPGAGTLEVRVNLATGWTKLEVEQAMERIFRFLSDVNNSTSLVL